MFICFLTLPICTLIAMFVKTSVIIYGIYIYIYILFVVDAIIVHIY